MRMVKLTGSTHITPNLGHCRSPAFQHIVPHVLRVDALRLERHVGVSIKKARVKLVRRVKRCSYVIISHVVTANPYTSVSSVKRLVKKLSGAMYLMTVLRQHLDESHCGRAGRAGGWPGPCASSLGPRANTASSQSRQCGSCCAPSQARCARQGPDARCAAIQAYQYKLDMVLKGTNRCEVLGTVGDLLGVVDDLVHAQADVVLHGQPQHGAKVPMHHELRHQQPRLARHAQSTRLK